MKKVKRKVTVLILVIVLVIVQSPQGIMASYPSVCSLSVTRYQQEKTNWCWAACTKMIASYLGYTSITQSGIVGYIKGTTVNETASTSEISRALQYAINSKYTVSATGVLYYEKIQSYISSGRPLGWGMTWYSGGAHMVVASGYVNGKITLMNPASGAATTSYTYTALVSGTTIQNGSGKYTTTWTLN